jgi:hypothetical protein
MMFDYYGKKSYKKKILHVLKREESVHAKIDEYSKIHNAKSLYRKTKVIKPDIPKRKVICLNDMKLYDSVNTVKRIRGINVKSMNKLFLKSKETEPIAIGLDDDKNILCWMYNDQFLKRKDLKLEANRKLCIKKITDEEKDKNPHKFDKKPNSKNPMYVMNESGEVDYMKHIHKRVICLNTLEVFNCINSAAKSCNATMSAMSHACSPRRLGGCGKDKNGNRLYWMLHSEYLDKMKNDKSFINNRLKEIELEAKAREEKKKLKSKGKR